MKISVLLSLCGATLAAAATTPTPTTTKPTIAPDCTQTQRQQINKLLEQNVNPAKACYSKARGDIVTLSTSRLCPLEECRDWLSYMAANVPECIYDDTNYGRDFRKKDKDCVDPANTAAGSGSGAAASATPKPTPTLGDGSAGLGSEAGVTSTPTPKPTTAAPALEASGSGSTDIEPIATTESPEVTFPPETPAPTTRAVTPVGSGATLASTCAALASVVVAVAALAL